MDNSKLILNFLSISCIKKITLGTYDIWTHRLFCYFSLDYCEDQLLSPCNHIIWSLAWFGGVCVQAVLSTKWSEEESLLFGAEQSMCRNN